MNRSITRALIFRLSFLLLGCSPTLQAMLAIFPNTNSGTIDGIAVSITSRCAQPVAGNGTYAFSGDGGSATAATICTPLGVTVDARGSIYFADLNNLRVRKITPLGKINTVAGSGIPGYNGENLPAVSTNLDESIAVGVNKAGTLFILDDAQARVRKVHCCLSPLALSAADHKLINPTRSMP